ncbi:MAG: YihY/virulence factor BrkB family protein [Gemmatimonadota bacterium]
MRIPGLRGLPLRAVAMETFREFQRDDMWSYGSALAFRAVFALFPFLLFLVALFSFLELPGLFDWLLDRGEALLPAEAQGQVREVVEEVRGQRRGGLLSFGVLGAVWVASGGVRSVMNALNAAYDVPEGRPWWKRFPLSVAYTLAVGALVVAATLLVVLGPRATAWILDGLGAGSGLLELVRWLRLPAAFLLATAAVTLVYLAGPNVRQRLRMVMPGAVLAVVLWVAATSGFRLYVANFGRFGVTYGSIGAVIILLAYLYLSSLILLLGAELNAVVQHRAPRPGDAVPKEEPEEDDGGG